MIISWNTTQACNLRCVHCYRDAGTRRDDELTTAQGKKLLDEMARAGFKIVILSGGPRGKQAPSLKLPAWQFFNG